MSRRDDDGGNRTASGEGDGENGEDTSSLEEEIREWVGETAAGSAVDEVTEKRGRGWLGRVFSREQSDDIEAEEEPAADVVATDLGFDPRLGADPETLAVFPAVSVDDESEAVVPGEEILIDQPPDMAEPGTDEESSESAGTATREPDAALTAAQEAGLQPSFADLWEGEFEGESEDAGEDVVDFSAFTSEDYLQPSTQEYAGLAEAVARAEEEEPQRIAVSAEMPGLESGLVGLDDVVSGIGGDAAGDEIAPPASSDLSMRVLTALGLFLLFGASLLSPFGIGALIIVVLGIAAGELFSALIRGGYRPLSLFGFVGIAGAFVGTWASGPIAIPIALLLTTIAVFLFYATVPGRRAALENATLTILVTAWIGGMGALAFDFLGSPDYRWLVLALVVIVAVMDVAQYFVGRRIGRHPLAPVVSPKKTIEGYVAGVVVAVGVGAAFGLAEPFDLADGLILGGVVAAVGPLGDLSVSVLKRALNVKDMGYILPGHGGVLDRVDAMVMAIPALWVAYSWMGLLT